MENRTLARVTTTVALLGTFSLGYLAGSTNQQRADAQGLGGILQQAEKAGGPLGSAAQLGSSLVEMQDHVSGLQKNIDTLKKVQAALGGGK